MLGSAMLAMVSSRTSISWAVAMTRSANPARRGRRGDWSGRAVGLLAVTSRLRGVHRGPTERRTDSAEGYVRVEEYPPGVSIPHVDPF
jgi:hypothetical protein